MTIFALLTLALLWAGYRFYGGFLEKIYAVSADEPVPSKTMADGVDYVPANKYVLLGHHFSSIAGAGPIVGPIIAAAAFGWLPAIVWIVLGTVFIGGLHDFSSLIISLRHEGRSISEIARKYINNRTYKLFLLFTWLALMYVVAVFADITADAFAKEVPVAQTGIAYILVAIAFGWALYRARSGLKLSTMAALLALGAAMYLSFRFQFLSADKGTWVWALLAYCFAASILPVWFLLQPRDYLSSYLLYVSLFIGLAGLLFGGYAITYPAFKTFHDPAIGGMVPFLFITIACGAASGFHSLVASGTTSKQLSSAGDARFMGYGSMVLEAVVAMIALGTIMVLLPGDELSKAAPAQIYAAGLGRFSALFGVAPETGRVFGLLIVSAFMLTTLDSATRIARYIFQELTGMGNSMMSRLLATAVSLALPVVLLNIDITGPSGAAIPCWKFIWPLFGVTNQLLAALVLVIIYIWARRTGIKYRWLILVPAVFMTVMTVWALSEMLFRSGFNFISAIGAVLLALSVTVIFESARAVLKKTA
ncbi:MAG: carbon starvation protein A [Elusimicrobia bacterium CG08_land_8_20_14_0_20_59_10]|nr:MAG: carbon starvation protein A [Elusimicrobia bacterium CG08_land_8_20_14_0_20_59_10]